MNRQGGAALLLVLWIVLLLAGLVAGYALTARVESLQGNGLARTVVAQQAARAGLEHAVARLLDPDPARRWPIDGTPHDWNFDGIAVQVAVADEAGRIDLNMASFDLLRDFFVALGQERAAATQLAGEVIDWRDPDSLLQPSGGAEDADYAAAGMPWGAKDAPFDGVSELAQLLHMTPALYAAAAPHLSVHAGQAMPDPASADAVVRKALGLPERDPGDPLAPTASGSGTYSIDSRARLADGRQARLSAVLRLGGSGLPGSTYTTLRWQADGAWQ